MAFGGSWQAFPCSVIANGSGTWRVILPVNVTSIPPCSLVAFKITGVDLHGNAIIVSGTFHAAAMSDLTPPNVTIIEPDPRITWSNNIVMSANVTDDSNVSYVEFYLDGNYTWNRVAILPMNASGFYQVETLDQGVDIIPGPHVLFVHAVDIAGWSTWVSRSFSVGNQIAIGGIKDGGFYIPSGANETIAMNVTSSYSDLQALSVVSWELVNGTWMNHGVESLPTMPGKYQVLLQSMATGIYGIFLQGTQAISGRNMTWGLQTMVPGMIITVNGEMPRDVAITNLVNGSWIMAGQHVFTFNATCHIPIANFTLFVDGTLYRQVPGSAASMTFDTNLFAWSGAHIFTIEATSATGISANATYFVHADMTPPIMNVTASPMLGPNIVTRDTFSVVVQAIENCSWITNASISINNTVVNQQSFANMSIISFTTSFNLTSLGIRPGLNFVTVAVTSLGGTIQQQLLLYRDIAPPAASFIAPANGSAISSASTDLVASVVDDYLTMSVNFYLGNPNATGASFLGSGLQGANNTWLLHYQNRIYMSSASLYLRAIDEVGNARDAVASNIDLLAPLLITFNMSDADMYGSAYSTSGVLYNMVSGKDYQVSMYYHDSNVQQGGVEWIHVGTSSVVNSNTPGGSWTINWDTSQFNPGSADWIPVDINAYKAYSGIDIPNIGIAGKFEVSSPVDYFIIGQGLGNHYIYAYKQDIPGTATWTRVEITTNYADQPAVRAVAADCDGDSVDELFLATTQQILGIKQSGDSFTITPLITFTGSDTVADIAFDTTNKVLYVARGNSVLEYAAASATAAFGCSVTTVNCGGIATSIDTGQLESVNSQPVLLFFATNACIGYFGYDHVIHDIDTGLSGVDRIKVGSVDTGSAMNEVVAGINVGDARSVVIAYQNTGTVASPAWSPRLVSQWDELLAFSSLDVNLGLAANVNPDIIVANSQNVTDKQLVGSLNHDLVSSLVTNNNPLYGTVDGTYAQYTVQAIGPGSTVTSAVDYSGYENYDSTASMPGTSTPASISANAAISQPIQAALASVTMTPDGTNIAPSAPLAYGQASSTSGTPGTANAQYIMTHNQFPGSASQPFGVNYPAVPDSTLPSSYAQGIQDETPGGNVNLYDGNPSTGTTSSTSISVSTLPVFAPEIGNQICNYNGDLIGSQTTVTFPGRVFGFDSVNAESDGTSVGGGTIDCGNTQLASFPQAIKNIGVDFPTNGISKDPSHVVVTQNPGPGDPEVQADLNFDLGNRINVNDLPTDGTGITVMLYLRAMVFFCVQSETTNSISNGHEYYDNYYYSPLHVAIHTNVQNDEFPTWDTTTFEPSYSIFSS